MDIWERATGQEVCATANGERAIFIWQYATAIQRYAGAKGTKSSANRACASATKPNAIVHCPKYFGRRILKKGTAW